MDLDASVAGGTVIADTAAAARDHLRNRGMTVLRVGQVRKRRALLPARRRLRRQGEVVAFVRELATLLGAGIPLLDALQTLTAQQHRRFKAVVQSLADQVAAGVNLADAMAKHADYFDELSVSIAAVGENTGSLAAALERLAEFKETTGRLTSRLTTALIYPAIVLAVGVAVAVFLMTYVVPNLLSTLETSGRPLPAITLLVKAASDLLRGWWWAIIGAAAAVAVAVRAALATPAGKRLADRLVLKLPLVGPLAAKENTSRMAVMLAALLRSGLQFTDALPVVRRTLRNEMFRQAMDDYAAAIAAGADISEPLRRSGVFAPMVVQMLAVGQESGRLEEMLEQLAASYDQQVALAAARLSAALEPLLVVAMAILVGVIAFATILPILELSNAL